MRKTIAILAVVLAGVLVGPAPSASARAKPVSTGTTTVAVAGPDTYFELKVTSTTGKAQLRAGGNTVLATATGSKTAPFALKAHVTNRQIGKCGTKTGWTLNDGKGGSTPLKIRFLCRSQLVNLGWTEGTDSFGASGTLTNYDPATDSWVPSPNRAVHLQEQKGSSWKSVDNSITDAAGNFSLRASHDWGSFTARLSTPATSLDAGTSSAPEPISVG